MKVYRLAVCGSTGRVGKLLVEIIESDPRYRKMFQVVLAFNRANEELRKEFLSKRPDVLIDFSHPDNGPQIAEWCFTSGAQLLVCTTGYTQDQRKHIELQCPRAVFVPNTSLGIALLETVIRSLAPQLPQGVKVTLTDIHRADKRDSPSGTALKLAGQMETQWPITDRVKIESVREGDVIGIHRIRLEFGSEILEMSHEGLDRKLWAMGALEQAHRLLLARSS